MNLASRTIGLKLINRNYLFLLKIVTIAIIVVSSLVPYSSHQFSNAYKEKSDRKELELGDIELHLHFFYKEKSHYNALMHNYTVVTVIILCSKCTKDTKTGNLI